MAKAGTSTVSVTCDMMCSFVENFANLKTVVSAKEVKCGMSSARESLLTGRISTVDLLALTSSDSCFHMQHDINLKSVFYRYMWFG